MSHKGTAQSLAAPITPSHRKSSRLAPQKTKYDPNTRSHSTKTPIITSNNPLCSPSTSINLAAVTAHPPSKLFNEHISPPASVSRGATALPEEFDVTSPRSPLYPVHSSAVLAQAKRTAAAHAHAHHDLHLEGIFEVAGCQDMSEPRVLRVGAPSEWVSPGRRTATATASDTVGSPVLLSPLRNSAYAFSPIARSQVVAFASPSSRAHSRAAAFSPRSPARPVAMLTSASSSASSYVPALPVNSTTPAVQATPTPAALPAVVRSPPPAVVQSPPAVIGPTAPACSPTPAHADATPLRPSRRYATTDLVALPRSPADSGCGDETLLFATHTAGGAISAAANTSGPTTNAEDNIPPAGARAGQPYPSTGVAPLAADAPAVPPLAVATLAYSHLHASRSSNTPVRSSPTATLAIRLAASAASTVPLDSPHSPAAAPPTPAPVTSSRRSPPSATLSIASTVASAARARRRRVMASAAVAAMPRARMPAGLPASLALLKRMAGISPMRTYQPHVPPRAPPRAPPTSPRPVARIADTRLAGGVRANLGYFSRPQYGGYITTHPHASLSAAATPFAATDTTCTPAPPSTARLPSTSSARRHAVSTRARTAALPATSPPSAVAAMYAATHVALPGPASPASERFHTPSVRAAFPLPRGLASRILTAHTTSTTLATTPSLTLSAAHASLPQLAVARSPDATGAATPQQLPRSRPHTRSQCVAPVHAATSPVTAQTPVVIADLAPAAFPTSTLTPNSFADAARARRQPMRLLAGTPVAHAGVGAAYSALAGDGLDVGVWGVRAWGVGRWGTLSVAASRADARTHALSSPMDGTEQPSTSPPSPRTALTKSPPYDDHTTAVHASASALAAPRRRRSMPALPGLDAFVHPSPLPDPMPTPPLSAGALAHSPGAASAAPTCGGIPLKRSTSLQLAARAALRLASSRRAQEQSVMAAMYQDLYSGPSVHHGTLPRPETSAHAEEAPAALLQWLSAEALGAVAAAKEQPVSVGTALHVGVTPADTASSQECAVALPASAPHWTMPPPAPRAPTPTHQKAGAGGWPRRRVPDIAPPAAPVGDGGAMATTLPSDVDAAASSAGSAANPNPHALRSKRKRPATDVPPLPHHEGNYTPPSRARATPSPTHARAAHPQTASLPTVLGLPTHAPAPARVRTPPAGATISTPAALSPAAYAAASVSVVQRTSPYTPTTSPARAAPVPAPLASLAARRLRAALTVLARGQTASPARGSPLPVPAPSPAENAVDTGGVDVRISKRARSNGPASAAEEPRDRTESVQLALPATPPVAVLVAPTAPAREDRFPAPVRAAPASAPAQSSRRARDAARAGSAAVPAGASTYPLTLARTPAPAGGTGTRATGLPCSTAAASSVSSAAPGCGALPSRLTALLARHVAAASRASPCAQVITEKRGRKGRAAPRQPRQSRPATLTAGVPSVETPVAGCPQEGTHANTLPHGDAHSTSVAGARHVLPPAARLSLATASLTSHRLDSHRTTAATVPSRLRIAQASRACSTSPIHATDTDGVPFGSYPRAPLWLPLAPPLSPSSAHSTPRALAASPALPAQTHCASSPSRVSVPAEDANMDAGAVVEEEELSEELIFLQLLRSALRTNAKLLFWRQSAEAHARIAERLREQREEEAQRRARELRAMDAVRRAEQQLWCLRGEERVHAASSRVQAACVRECAYGIRDAHEAAARLVAAERERWLEVDTTLTDHPLADQTRVDPPSGLPERDDAALADANLGLCTPNRTAPLPADSPTLVLPCGARVGASERVCHHVYHHCHCTRTRTERAVAAVLSPQTLPVVAAADDVNAVASVGIVEALSDPEFADLTSSSSTHAGCPAPASSASVSASVPSMYARTPPPPSSAPDAFVFPSLSRAPPHSDVVLRRKRRMPDAPNTAPALRRRPRASPEAITSAAAAPSVPVEFTHLSQQVADKSAAVAVAPVPPKPPVAPVVYRVDGRRRTVLRHSAQLAAYDRKRHHSAAHTQEHIHVPCSALASTATVVSATAPPPDHTLTVHTSLAAAVPAMDPALATLFASDSWRAVVAAAAALLPTESVSRLRDGYAAEVMELLSRRERPDLVCNSSAKHPTPLWSGDVIDLGAGATVQGVRAELREACHLDTTAYIRVRMAADAMVRWEAALKSTLRECLG